MSQDIRTYLLERVDDDPAEAFELHVTATVGPTPTEGETRGVQLTLETPDGFAYARVSEPQLQDLADLIARRIDPDQPPEATGLEAENLTVEPDGETHG